MTEFDFGNPAFDPDAVYDEETSFINTPDTAESTAVVKPTVQTNRRPSLQQ